MAKTKFTSTSFIIRLLFAAILVFASYNPVQTYSYYHWALQPLIQSFESFSVLKGFLGVILLIGWTIFLRATFRSLGFFGTLLAIAFFSLLIWLLVDRGWIGLENQTTLTWLVLVGLCGVLAAGISWSHIRRRITGQLDVDDTDN